MDMQQTALASHKRDNSGFTLIELIVVIVIIGILFAMVAGLSGLARRKANESKAVAEIQELHNALLEYKLRYGSFPSSSNASATNLASSAVTNWLPADFDFRDPWQNDYIYKATGAQRYRLYSSGPDGEEGSPEADGDNIE